MESGMRGGDLVSSFALLVDRLRFWSLWVSSAFLVPALLRPGILHPLNVLWFRFGLMLGGVVAPVVMGVIYFATVTPTGLLMRLFGKDLLRTRLDPKSETYWVERAPEPVEPNEADAERGRSMRDQF